MLRPTNTHEKRGSGRISPNTRQYGFHPALWSGINYFAFSTYTKTFLTKRRRAARLRSDICCQFTPFNFRMTHAYNILTLRGFRLSGCEFKKEKKKAIKIPSRRFGGAFARRCQVSGRHPQPFIRATVLLLCCNVIISSLSFISNF